MKKIIVCMSVLLISFSVVAQSPVLGQFKKLQWLEGEWSRTNQKPGRSGLEQWIISSETEMRGKGITMKGKDTAFVEKLKLVVKDNHIYYVADVPENKDPVLYKLTRITDDEFTCENPDHDFPKMIVYKKDGSKLKATISGNGKAIEYLFQKRENRPL